MSSTNRAANRISQDDYPTPIWCVELIKQEINFKNVQSFLEPCLGEGNIYNTIKTEVDGDWEWDEIKEGRDYLKTPCFKKFDLIVTNPPFSLALEFLQKSLGEAYTVIYLLRLNFLGSQTRKQFWNENPPSHVFVLSKRPSFTGNGTDSCEYAWFVWRGINCMKRKPGIYVI